MDHLTKLILVMVLFGLLGGVVNFIYIYPKNKKGARPFSDLLKSLVTGIAASFMVPVFLNMISSNLVRESETDPIKLVVFAGFCVIASASSKSFITGISGKVLEKVSKVEEDVQAVKTEIKPVILKHTEPDAANIPGYTSGGTDSSLVPEPDSRLDEARIKILEKLSDSDYAFRTINGLAKDANLEPELVRECLQDCISSGLAGIIDNGMGIRFYITEDGQAHLMSLNGKAGTVNRDESRASSEEQR